MRQTPSLQTTNFRLPKNQPCLEDKIITGQKVADNILKGIRLENAFELALDELGVSYEDKTKVYNFKNEPGGGTPDFIVSDKIAIELKNWNCKEYRIDEKRAYSEIVKRFLNYQDKRRILIIANPRWKRPAKQYLEACGIKVYELGYFVDKEKFTSYKITIDLKKIVKHILGYWNNTIISIVKRIRYFFKYGEVKVTIVKARLYEAFKLSNHAKSSHKRQETIDQNISK
jgi:hypothetical protein